MEKLGIARKHLVPELLENHGSSPAQVTLSDEAILEVIRINRPRRAFATWSANWRPFFADRPQSWPAGPRITNTVEKDDMEAYLACPRRT